MVLLRQVFSEFGLAITGWIEYHERVNPIWHRQFESGN
jgi:hypothetical protein